MSNEAEFRGLSLRGEAGREVARKLAAITLGKMSVAEAGPGFSLTPDGTLSIDLDDESAAALNEITR